MKKTNFTNFTMRKTANITMIVMSLINNGTRKTITKEEMKKIGI